MAVATSATFVEEAVVLAVEEEVAGVTRVETAAVIETSETDEMTPHLFETTVAGSVIETGGIVNETASVDDAPHQDPEDRHPAEISETATSRSVSKPTVPDEAREMAARLVLGRPPRILPLAHSYTAEVVIAAEELRVAEEETGTVAEDGPFTMNGLILDSGVDLKKDVGAALVTETTGIITVSWIQICVLGMAQEMSVSSSLHGILATHPSAMCAQRSIGKDL